MPLTAAGSPESPPGRIRKSRRKEDETIFTERENVRSGARGRRQQGRRRSVQKMDTHDTEAVGDRDLKESSTLTAGISERLH